MSTRKIGEGNSTIKLEADLAHANDIAADGVLELHGAEVVGGVEEIVGGVVLAILDLQLGLGDLAGALVGDGGFDVEAGVGHAVEGLDADDGLELSALHDLLVGGAAGAEELVVDASIEVPGEHLGQGDGEMGMGRRAEVPGDGHDIASQSLAVDNVDELLGVALGLLEETEGGDGVGGALQSGSLPVQAGVETTLLLVLEGSDKGGPLGQGHEVEAHVGTENDAVVVGAGGGEGLLIESEVGVVGQLNVLAQVRAHLLEDVLNPLPLEILNAGG